MRPHLILSTGIYRFRSVESYRETSLTGRAVRLSPYGFHSVTAVPGVGVGIGAVLPLRGPRWGLDFELRVHTLIGAAEALYPVATLTVGLGKLLVSG